MTIARCTLCLGLLMVGPSWGDTFTFTTGSPDGRIGLASRPAGLAGIEIETADDFILSSQTIITSATFTGLVPSGLPLTGITFAGIELYRVFPADSGPFDGLVPTRTNSPSDAAFASRDSTAGDLTFTRTLVSPSFTASNSIVNGIHRSLMPATGGEGAVTGEEVTINVTFTNPFVLDPGHYFFKPEAGLTSGTFLWLSTARPGPIFVGDLQAWIRDQNLDPDWLRAGTDIVDGATPPTFNAAFSLNGTTVPEPATIVLLCSALLPVAVKLRRQHAKAKER